LGKVFLGNHWLLWVEDVRSAMTNYTVNVSGMTCDHCVRAVKEELGGLRGVTEVGVELNPEGDSVVTVSSSVELAEADFSAALDEAGYAMVGGPQAS